MIKYDLNDIGYKYKGISSTKVTSIKSKSGWNIIDIPVDEDINKIEKFVEDFIGKIVAIELPTSLVCNLRCKYCYIDDPRMKNKIVSSDTITSILEKVKEYFPRFDPKNVNEKDKVYFSPWGAEPFANISTLETVYEFAHEHYGKDKYILHTSTNGTISSKKIFDFLNNVYMDGALPSIQVSLDGPEYLQNKYRPSINDKINSYEQVKKFCFALNDISKEHNIKNRLYSFCSTIHLVDDDFAKHWVDAADFFSEPNTWHTSLPSLPMRMSGEDMASPEHVERFVEAQKLIFELIKNKTKKNNIPIVDFYSYKLFGMLSTKTRNSFPYCSALNTQMGIDVDGNIYPCHGPITSPEYKPFLWLGNIFEKTISFKQLYRNLSYQYGTLWTKGKCKECPLNIFSLGNICWSCAPHNLAITGEPSMDSVIKCIAYEASFKYWIAIAKMCIDNPILNKIPENWYNDIILSEDDINAIKQNDKIQNPITKHKCHFDMNYDGLIEKAVERMALFNKCKQNCGYEKLTDSWWEFDNYLDIVAKN